jgi:hypothetical protein
VDGRVAGHAAGGRPEAARSWFLARGRARTFAESLYWAFVLRDELKALPRPEKVVCRWEDVSYARVLGFDSAPGEAPGAVRDGALPGARLRPRARVLAGLGGGFGLAPVVAGFAREPGGGARTLISPRRFVRPVKG